MPIIENSSYKGPSKWLFNGHLETILPSLFRKIKGVAYDSIKINTSDGDELTLDCLRKNNSKVVILTHGLEGDSERHYITGLAKYYHQRGFDVIAWNCRTCGKSQNITYKLYHHADIYDLEEVVNFVVGKLNYKQISLVGFSMGGNITLNYLGKSKSVNLQYIKSSVAVSVPCDLYGCVKELKKSQNSVYTRRFLKKLNEKLFTKASQFPNEFSAFTIKNYKSFEDLDRNVTAPLYGFKDEQDYYKQASSKFSIPYIKKPTLIINAENDPMLSESCYPKEIVKNHPKVYLECPTRGGHTGFTLSNSEFSWVEIRSFEFISKYY